MNKAMTILGNRTTEKYGGPRASGKIRCGTKVLTAPAQSNEQAVKIYETGRATRRRASLIEKEITEKTRLRNPMRPVNTREFHLAADDFTMAVLPEAILAQYGEDVAGRRVLHRFPVFFHSNELFEFFPHRFESHAGDDKFHSSFNAAGVRVCERLAAPDPETIKAQREAGVKRLPPRDWQVRGLCEPSVCKEFQAGHCTFRGHLKFYVPGVVGLGLVEMETSSEYAAENIWSTLDQIRNALGFVPNFNPKDPGRPVFWITKVQEQRTYFDANGNRKQGLQWVPTIVPEIDIAAMLSLGRTPMPVAAPPAWLASVSEAQPLAREEQTVPEASEVQKGASPIAHIEEMLHSAGINRELFLRYVEHRSGTGWEIKPAEVEGATQALAKIAKYGPKVDLLLEARLIPRDYDIDAALFARYAKKAVGEWERNFTQMGALIAHVRELFANGRDAGLAAMKAACPEEVVQS
ncbi:hypothetical protein [Paraburkholderia sp. J8-2]|uniref:recombination directionality factor n=1 Tax=Paraburkholderia sp. J8-2 TaxID=2805440 RepID=UPI002AB62E2E|nr:hypothetical protein [Paraburkholderia sp. J8-2]